MGIAIQYFLLRLFPFHRQILVSLLAAISQHFIFQVLLPQIGDKQRLAFVRVGNESVVADRLQLKSLVMQSAGRSFDAIPSPYKFEDMAFSKLKSVHFKRLNQ